jgi:hypothetical protein
MASIDDNVPLFLALLLKGVKTSVRKAYLWFAVNPEMPWVESGINKNAELNAKAIAKELGLDKNNDWYE